MRNRGETLNRRAFLRRLGLGAAATTGATAFARHALAAEDLTLQALIQQNQQSDFGQGFDSASRTIQMPKASLPTLAPSTAQTTEQAIQRYEGIVANGGWPNVPAGE